MDGINTRVGINESGEWTYEGLTVDEQVQRALAHIACNNSEEELNNV